MSLNNNAAFPISDSNPYAKGLTKREMFAMAAMQGLLANSDAVDEARLQPNPPRELAHSAVQAADALLAALEQPA